MADLVVSSLGNSPGDSSWDRKYNVSRRSHSNAALRQFIKQTCCSFSQWRPWQQRILLCGLTNRCSVHQLELLSSALEPIFHRDFATALTGSYPQSALREGISVKRKLDRLERLERSSDIINRPDKRVGSRRQSNVSRKSSSLRVGAGRDSGLNRSTKLSVSSVSEVVSQASSRRSRRSLSRLRSKPSMSGETNSAAVQSWTAARDRVVSSDAESANEFPVFSTGNGDGNMQLVASSLESFSLSRTHIRDTENCSTNFQSSQSQPLALNPVSLLPLRGKLAHDHLPSYNASDVSGPSASTDNYFLPQDSGDDLAEMKAKVMPVMARLAMGTYFITPQRGRLAERFKSQLKEIWRYLESTNDQHHADLLHALIKSSNPSTISFISYCLFQRLHDQTSITSLPDLILLRIFSCLDSYTLYHCAQVCKRWRFLSFLSPQWQQRLDELGSSRGVNSLTKAVEEVGKDRYIDWRRAYQEISIVKWHGNATATDQQQSVVGDSGKASESSLLNDLQAVNVADLDLRTLMLIAKVNGIKEEQATGLTQPIPRSTTDGEDRGGARQVVVELDKCYHTGVTLGDHSQAHGTKPDNEQDGVTVTKEAGVDGKRRHRGTDFIVSVKNGDIKQNEAQKDATPLVRKVEKPKILSIALDVRPQKTTEAHPTGSFLLSLAGLIMEDDDEEYVSLLLHSEELSLDVRNVRRLRGHMGAVTCACFDIRRLMTGSMDRTLRVGDIRSGRHLATLEGHKGGVHCVQFDNKKIITGSWDMTCKVWDVISFTETHTLTGHRGCVSAMKLHGDLLVTGSHDKTLRIWNTRNWLCQHVIIAHSASVNCMDFDGARCVSGSSDRTLRLWCVQSGQCLQLFSGHQDSVLCCQLQEKLLASGCAGGSVNLWDTSTGEVLVHLEQAHAGPIHAIAFKDSNFFTGGSDNQIKEWSLASCSCLRSLQGHTGSIEALQTVNERLVSCSGDWTVRIWESNPPLPQLGSIYDMKHCENIAVKRIVGKVNENQVVK